MEIVFLGTGGGRINLIKQIRGTGGFRINSASANIHVDPGPGGLIHSLEEKQDPLALDVIIVTHNHVDHVSDAMALIEAMASYGLKRRGIIIGSRHTIVGDEKGDKGISTYHQAMASVVYSAEWGSKKLFNTEKGSFELQAFKMQHEELTTFGFKLNMDGSVLGYITDTEYIESLGTDFAGCDCLIVNCIKPEEDKFKGHLWSEEVIKVLKIAKPKTCIMTHMGLKMLKVGPAAEAERIGLASGVRVVAAKDGMRYNF